MNNPYFSRFALLACGLLFGLSSPCLAVKVKAVMEPSHVARRDVYRAPDRSLIASVIFLKQRIYGDPPSRIEIRRADGRLLYSKDYSSYDGQGYTVRKAGWTADGRFFVYKVHSSGGHSPWHSPIFFYSRKRQRFYSLDNAIGALRHGDGAITGGLQFRKPCTVLTNGRYFGKSRKGLRVSVDPEDANWDPTLAIDLGRLEPHLGSSAEDVKF